MANKSDDWTKELEADLATPASNMWGTLTEDKQNLVMGRPPDMPDFTIAQVSK
jgi:hypothetical protein